MKRTRCAYCGSPCYGKTCQDHRDLTKLEEIPDQYSRWNVADELAAELQDVLDQQRRRYAYKGQR